MTKQTKEGLTLILLALMAAAVWYYYGGKPGGSAGIAILPRRNTCQYQWRTRESAGTNSRGSAGPTIRRMGEIHSTFFPHLRPWRRKNPYPTQRLRRNHSRLHRRLL